MCRTCLFSSISKHSRYEAGCDSCLGCLLEKLRIIFTWEHDSRNFNFNTPKFLTVSLLNFRDQSGAKVCKRRIRVHCINSCSSRNSARVFSCLLANIGVDTAENESPEGWSQISSFFQSNPYGTLGEGDVSLLHSRMSKITRAQGLTLNARYLVGCKIDPSDARVHILM